MQQGIHIRKFLDRLRSLEAQKASQYIMSMHEAKELHNDITKLLLELKNCTQSSLKEKDPTVDVEIRGGSF